MVSSGIVPDASAYTYLVNQLCKRGNVGYAMQLVEKMDDHGYPSNTVTCNALVRGLCMLGSLNQSLQFVEKLMQKGLAPNVFTYSFLLEAAYKERGADEAVKLLDEIIAKGGEPNLVSYHVLLTGFCKEGRTDDAMKLFRELPRKGFKPNVRFTHDFYKSVITSLCRKGNTFAAFQLLYEMVRCGFDPDSHTYSALIRGLCLEGMFNGAMEILSIVEESEYYKPTVDNFNAMILGFCKTRGRMEVFEMMVETKRMPNETTYSILVEGIAHEDELELAKDVLEELRLRNVVGQNAVDRIVMQFNLD